MAGEASTGINKTCKDSIPEDTIFLNFTWNQFYNQTKSFHLTRLT